MFECEMTYNSTRAYLASIIWHCSRQETRFISLVLFILVRPLKYLERKLLKPPLGGIYPPLQAAPSTVLSSDLLPRAPQHLRQCADFLIEQIFRLLPYWGRLSVLKLQ